MEYNIWHGDQFLYAQHNRCYESPLDNTPTFFYAANRKFFQNVYKMVGTEHQFPV